MRDIGLVILFAVLVLMMLRDAKSGAYAWAWLSIFNPHRMTYGFAYNIPFAQITAVLTLIRFAMGKERKPFPWCSITAIHLMFLCWMGVTSIFAINTTEIVIDRVFWVGKIQIMFLLTLMLVRGRADIEKLIWVVTLSVAFFGIKGGAFTVLTGGVDRVYGPPGGMLEENNAFAVAEVITVPLLYYLSRVTTRKWVRWGLYLSIALCAFSILGSQSRGALLAVSVMTLMLGLKSRYPVRLTVLFCAAGLLAVSFMPQTWTERMETMQAYNTESSALSRLFTWNMIWNLAKDRPIVGAGFGIDNRDLYARYASFEGKFSIFTPEHAWVAHSIYFQALGEHGFPGLFLFVGIGVATWVKASRLAKRARDDPEFGPWVPLLMKMVQVSLLGFAVGGAFLTMVHFDVPYYMIGYVVMVDATIKDRERARSQRGNPLSVATARHSPAADAPALTLQRGPTMGNAGRATPS